jgi:hypothetical protein
VGRVGLVGLVGRVGRVGLVWSVGWVGLVWSVGWVGSVWWVWSGITRMLVGANLAVTTLHPNDCGVWDIPNAPGGASMS